MEKQDEDYILSLFPAIRKIKDEDIRQKVILTWYNAWKRGNYSRIEDAHQFEPARGRIVYSNVEHTNQVCQACERMGEVLAEVLNLRVNMDHLLAGALLHDVDKMVIFKRGGFSETGQGFPHAVMGATMARKEGLPEAVVHMIEAHSAKFSPHPPRSIEAVIMRQVDHVIYQSVYISQGLDVEKIVNEAAARPA